jgi:hypothetical protein
MTPAEKQIIALDFAGSSGGPNRSHVASRYRCQTYRCSRLSPWPRLDRPALLLCVVLLVRPINGAAQSSVKTCGPPSYCARTDRRVEPYTAAPPALGPAGSIITDPTFGSRIARVTDGATDARHSGASFNASASAEQNTWNTDSTRFIIGERSGGIWLYDFNPISMTIRKTGQLKVPWRGTAQFSYRQRNLLYAVSARNPVFQEYDTASERLTTVHNPSSCFALQPSDWSAGISVSADDSRMISVFGPQQDRNYLLYVYDRRLGCRWYNTQTGEIGGQWGPKGRITDSRRFTIHDAHISKSGEFVEISGGGKGPTFWQLDTMNVTLCANKADHCLGHHAMGYSHLLNSPNRVHPLEFVVRPLNNLSAIKPLLGPMPPLIGWYDYHVSWNYANSQDDTPACFSTYRPGNPNSPGTPLLVNGPWENEIDCVETDGKGSTVWRFAHTYSTARNGFWSTPRGNMSQDGRFFMFTSDWQDQLGLGPKGKQYRTDVFIVELR